MSRRKKRNKQDKTLEKLRELYKKIIEKERELNQLKKLYNAKVAEYKARGDNHAT